MRRIHEEEKAKNAAFPTFSRPSLLFTTKSRTGCMFAAVGATCAASKILFSFSCSISFFVYFRTEYKQVCIFLVYTSEKVSKEK